MAILEVIIGISTLAIACQLYWNLSVKVRNLPPGPSPLSCLKDILLALFSNDLHALINEKLRHKQYGDIVYLPLPGANSIRIYSSKIAKKILKDKNSLHRPVLNGIGENNNLNIGSTADGISPFATVNGKEWERRRKLSQTILFRMCTSKFVCKILDETLTNVVIKEINKICDNNKLWYPSDLMKYSAFNTIFYANYGKHISYYDP
eukprot:508840_1